jgi:hypothetical protein
MISDSERFDFKGLTTNYNMTLAKKQKMNNRSISLDSCFTAFSTEETLSGDD